MCIHSSKLALQVELLIFGRHACAMTKSAQAYSYLYFITILMQRCDTRHSRRGHEGRDRPGRDSVRAQTLLVHISIDIVRVRMVQPLLKPPLLKPLALRRLIVRRLHVVPRDCSGLHVTHAHRWPYKVVNSYGTVIRRFDQFLLKLATLPGAAQLGGPLTSRASPDRNGASRETTIFCADPLPRIRTSMPGHAAPAGSGDEPHLEVDVCLSFFSTQSCMRITTELNRITLKIVSSMLLPSGIISIPARLMSLVADAAAQIAAPSRSSPAFSSTGWRMGDRTMRTRMEASTVSVCYR